MKVVKIILILLFLSVTKATINPKDKKSKQQKKKPAESADEVENLAILQGPVKETVYERNLVSNSPFASDIIAGNGAYFEGTNVKNFNGTCLGYVTPWNSHGYDISKIFGQKFDIISPVWLQIVRKGEKEYEITGIHDIDKGWMDDVKRKGKITKIYPRILFEHFTDKDYTKLLSYQEEIQAAVMSIIKVCQKYEFDGVVLELWSQLALRVDDHHLVNLVKTISRKLKEKKIRTILVVPPSQRGPDLFNKNHFEELWQDVQYFSLMTYDFSSFQRPGANAPLSWMQKVVEHITQGSNMKEKRQKILLGLNFYGYDFTPEGGEAVVGSSYLQLLKHYKGRLKFDEHDHENFFEVKTPSGRHYVFYPTLYSIQTRIDLARELGVNIAIWEIGQGLDYFYDLI